MKTNKHIFRSLKLGLGILTVLIPLLGTAQSNPWDTAPKGENPWVTEEEAAEQKTEAVKEISTLNADSVLSVDSLVSKPTQKTVAELSTNTDRYFNFSGDTIHLNTKSVDFHKSLHRMGRRMHSANGSLALGAASCGIFSIVAIPANLVGNAIPTSQIENKIEQFIKDNPHATNSEIKAIKRGISGKRYAKALGGMAIGCVVNLGVLISLYLL